MLAVVSITLCEPSLFFFYSFVGLLNMLLLLSQLDLSSNFSPSNKLDVRHSHRAQVERERESFQPFGCLPFIITIFITIITHYRKRDQSQHWNHKHRKITSNKRKDVEQFIKSMERHEIQPARRRRRVQIGFQLKRVVDVISLAYQREEAIVFELFYGLVGAEVCCITLQAFG